MKLELPLEKRKTKQLITSEIIERVACTQFFFMNQKDNIYLQKLHKELLQFSMRHNGNNEVGFLVDLLTWDKIIIKGKESYITLDGNLEASNKLKTAYTNSLMFLHNHPNNSCFSYADLRTFCINDSLNTITAIGNNANIHILTKTNSFNANAVINEYNKGVATNTGVVNVLQHSKQFGLLYKFGRCKNEKN